jgi:hypothetical protein
MQIKGPMKISVAESPDGQGRVLIVGFQTDFQGLEVAQQAAGFRAYLEELQGNIAAIEDENDRNRAGMLIIQQVAEQLLPHIESGELALEESIIIQIGQDDQALALTDLLRQTQ